MNNTEPIVIENIPIELIYPLFKNMLKVGSVTFKVTGISMQPMVYNRRDTVTIVSPPKQLKKGDLPFYRTDDGQFLLHRVIKINKDGSYDCRGDNRWESEKGIRQDQIIGIVTEFTRNNKKYSVFAPIYRVYVALWPLLHHFKKYYSILNAFKKNVIKFQQYLKFLIKPKKIFVNLEAGKTIEIKFRSAINYDIPKIQKLCTELIELEEEKFGAKTVNKFWYTGDEGKKLFNKYIDNHFLYIAIYKNEVVGYIRGNISRSLSLKQPVAYLQNIYILPEYRGLGIGNEFMAQFRSYCNKNNCHTMNVTFMENNLQAEKFYKNNGFVSMTKTYICELDDDIEKIQTK